MRLGLVDHYLLRVHSATVNPVPQLASGTTTPGSEVRVDRGEVMAGWHPPFRNELDAVVHVTLGRVALSGGASRPDPAARQRPVQW